MKRRIMIKLIHVIICLFLFLIFGNIDVNGQKAAFTADKTSGCSPLIVSFNGSTSEGAQLNYTWDFGNGGSSSGPDKVLASAIYTQPGVYTVKLTVTNATGQNFLEIKNYITIFPKPATDFQTSDNILGCIPHTMKFFNKTPEGTAAIKSWTWDFGDGESSSLQNPDHTYTTPGDYTLSLLTTDANGCKNSISKKDAVHIRENLSTDFITVPANQTYCKLPVVSTFKSKVTNNTGYPTIYLWDFGDGASSNLADPQHEYTIAGNYPVTLRIKNDIPGCEATKKMSSLINIANYSTDFTATTSGCLPVVATFTNISTVPPGAAVYSWDFGDGTPISHEVNPIHNYNQAGSYTVSLSTALPDPACVVPPAVKNNLINVNATGTIDFSSNQQGSCNVPFTVSFTDLSDKGISYAWDFGDGSSSSEKNPSHVYTTSGMFSVTLKVTEAGGCVKLLSKSNYIKLNKPVADFTSPVTNGCIPFTASFKDISSVPEQIVNRFWDFGDGTSSGDEFPYHTFNSPGSYPVSLKITTASGCSSTSRPFVFNAGTKPHAELDNNFPHKGCKPLKHTFQTNLSHSFDSLWLQPEVTQAGGKGSSITIKPGDATAVDYTYTTPGIFNPYLIAFKGGCSDTFFIPNGITVLPPKAIINLIVPPCNTGAVSFHDASIGATSVLWNFGTGSPHDTSSARNPSFTYGSAGAYTVTLTAYYDLNGIHCEDMVSMPLYIPNYAIGQRDFSADKNQGCTPLDINFTPHVQYADPAIKINSLKWLFGDGNTASESSSKHTYGAGIFDVKLVVQNSLGCIDTITKKEFIKSSGPDAQFLSPSSGCYPFKLTSSDRSTGIFPIQNRSWRLGTQVISHGNDTSISYTFNQKKPTAAEQKNGITLSLTITDNLGCVDSTSKQIQVTIPIINYQKEVSPTCFGDTILFKKTMSNDTSGVGPFTFQWHFSDGIMTGDNIRHFFAKGNNNSYLKVIDKFGCSDSVNILSDVKLSAPKADFSASPRLITCWPGQVVFKDSSQTGKVGIKNYKWDFGDTSAVSILKNPAHIYNNSGVYDIKLIIVDSIGCTDTIKKSDYITVRGPVGTFIEDTTYGYAPLKVAFTTTSTNVAKFVWDYGDGNLGSAKSSDHIYEHPGNYIPKLIVEDELGCKNIFQQDTIRVIPCAPHMQKIDTSFCFGNSITLKAGYPSSVHEWIGRADSSASITTKTGGLYVAKITIKGMPCFAYDTFNIHVIDLRFKLGQDTTVCFGQSIQLDTKVSSEYLFNWTVKDKDSTYQIPGTRNDSSLKTQKSGRYFVEVHDKANICLNKDSATIRVLPLVKANAGPDIEVCKGARAVLKGSGGTIFNWAPNMVHVPTYSFLPVRSATYILTVTDSLHCAESSDTMEVKFHPLPVSKLPKNQIFCFEDSTYSFPSGEGMYYEWNPGNQSSPIFQVAAEGSYKVKLFNEWGCSVETDITIQGICGPTIFPPQAFSPNGDGSNDTYKVFGFHFKNYELTVFSRWGEIIYKTNDPQAEWDGKYNLADMPSGVYAFTITYESLYPDDEGKTFRKKGSITLVR